MTTHVIASSHTNPHSTPSVSSSSGQATIGQHFRVGKKIGEGSFGVVFEGVNLLNMSPVAIKFEPRKSDAPQLRDEYRSYRILNGCPGIPQVHFFGQEGLHNVLVLDLFGPNLEDLFDMCGRKYSVKTVCMLAKQMVSRVQSIHDKNLIYRDIKPDNFLIGAPGTRNANLIHIIDFGMAKHYRDPRSHTHIPYRERKSLSGTARYMSINTHLGREQSRRDDLESLGHVFMYFLRGGLPWQGLKAATNKQKYEKIGQKKESTPIEDLCDGFPEEFAIYMNYVRKLGFEESPDYDFLRSLFSKVLEMRDDVDDGKFDWMALNGGRGWEAGNTPSALLAHAHAQAANTPQKARRHRTEKEREQDKERRHREREQRDREKLQVGGNDVGLSTPSTPANASNVAVNGVNMSPLVMPTPAAKKRDRHDRLPIGVDTSPNPASIAAIPPTSRRVSGIQNQLQTSSPVSPHPYASAMHVAPPVAANGTASPVATRANSNAHKPLPNPFPGEGNDSARYRPVEGMRIENGGMDRDMSGGRQADGDARPRKGGLFSSCCR